MLFLTDKDVTEIKLNIEINHKQQLLKKTVHARMIKPKSCCFCLINYYSVWRGYNIWTP